MDHNRLGRLDTKLLLALQILIEERSVTKAAERLNVSQPAMSKTLLRLKQLFNDPLFTRSAHGLVATPKTQQLAIDLPPLLRQLQQLMNQPNVDPALYRGRFRISAPQLISQTTLPKLVANLCHSAPFMQIEVTELTDDYLENLATGRLDFVLQRQQDFGNDYLSYPIGNGGAGCLMRRGHPLSKQSDISMDDYLSYPHIRVFFPGITDDNTGIIDKELKRQQLKRRIIFETTHLTSALEALATTDCLMVGSLNFTSFNRFRDMFHVMDFPDDLVFPEVPFALLQHVRTEKSQAHNWLRQQVLEVSQMPTAGASEASATPP